MQAKSYLPFTRPLAFSSVNLGADGRREITSLSDNPIIIRVNCAGPRLTANQLRDICLDPHRAGRDRQYVIAQCARRLGRKKI